MQVCKVTKRRKEMEFFILMISVPLFLIVVLLLSVFVLAKYSDPETAKAVSAEVSATETAEGADKTSPGNVAA
jgi:hypothetical protein